MNANIGTVGYRYITRQAGVRGGHAIIEGTRIGAHDVAGLLQNGESVGSVVVRCFPNITRAQVYEWLAYYEDQRGEIDRDGTNGANLTNELAYYEDHRGEIDLLVAHQISGPTP